MEKRDWNSISYVANLFRRHYISRMGEVKAPYAVKQREFGFLSFEGRTMLRHIAFDDVGRLRHYLAESGPSHVYYSSAYYSAPEAEMEWKGWLGADLVFDIDADHIDTPCKADHDSWRCNVCEKTGIGRAPERCPQCGKAAFEEKTWFCERCLHAAKYEAQKLLDFLIQDFGFYSKELQINFSGNRGYHVHVKSPHIKSLDQVARREIVDYIMGTGIKPEFHGYSRTPVGLSTLSETGWRGRITKALYDYIGRVTTDQVTNLKLSKESARRLLMERNEILRVLRQRNPSHILLYIDQKSLCTLMEAAVKEQASAIDTVVTTDLHRLIRLPNTLHGKTGLLSQTIDIEDLWDYDPLTSAMAFNQGTATVYIKRAPRFRIGDEEYGPFEEERAELPIAVSIFLLCRRAARFEA